MAQGQGMMEKEKRKGGEKMAKRLRMNESNCIEFTSNYTPFEFFNLFTTVLYVLNIVKYPMSNI